MNNIVSIENLCFKYNRETVLTNLNLNIKQGSIFGLVGKNGAGKTTLLKIMMGLLNPKTGKIKICGVENSDIFKEKVGFLPEEPYYHQEFKLKEYLTYLSKISSTAITEARIDEIIDLTYLTEVKDCYLQEFSKGMMQRVGLAQTILEKPELLILDEPMSGLDPVGQNKLRKIILKANNKGTSVMVTSHNIPEVNRICDQIGLLHQGQVKMIGEDAIEEGKYYSLELKNDIPEQNFEENFPEAEIKIQDNKLQFPVKEKELYFRVMDFLAQKKIEIKHLETTTSGVERIILNYLDEGVDANE